MKKNKKNKFGYGIKAYPEEKNVFVSYSIKIQCSTITIIRQSLPLSKYNHLKK
jgi:hypothetical protein